MRSIFGAVALSAFVAVGAVGAQDAPLTIQAVGLSLGGIDTPAGTTPVTIRIDRWSTDAERDRLRDSLTESGEDALLKTLRGIKPQVGSVSTGGSLGWQIQYAHQVELPGGGRRIVFATDRPMTFAERVGNARSSDYEYLLGEIRVDANGKGSGTLVPRADIMYDSGDKSITIERYDQQPVRLTSVRVRSTK